VSWYNPKICHLSQLLAPAKTVFQNEESLGLAILNLTVSPSRAACMRPDSVRVFAKCVSESISYQLNEGGGFIDKATQEAVEFCYSRNAR